MPPEPPRKRSPSISYLPALFLGFWGRISGYMSRHQNWCRGLEVCYLEEASRLESWNMKKSDTEGECPDCSWWQNTVDLCGWWCWWLLFFNDFVSGPLLLKTRNTEVHEHLHFFHFKVNQSVLFESSPHSKLKLQRIKKFPLEFSAEISVFPSCIRPQSRQSWLIWRRLRRRVGERGIKPGMRCETEERTVTLLASIGVFYHPWFFLWLFVEKLQQHVQHVYTWHGPDLTSQVNMTTLRQEEKDLSLDNLVVDES